LIESGKLTAQQIELMTPAFQKLRTAVVELSDAQKRAEGMKAFKGAVGDLDQEIAELNRQLAGNIELTRVSQVEQMLLTDAYKNLTQAEQDNIIVKAQKVDALRAALKGQIDAQKAYNEQFEKTREFIRGTFDILLEKGKSWGDKMKAIFGGIADKFKNMLLDMVTNWLTSKLMGGGQQNSSGSGGGGIGGILNGIFGGGGATSGPGGTPNFNPNGGGNVASGGGGGWGNFLNGIASNGVIGTPRVQPGGGGYNAVSQGGGGLGGLLQGLGFQKNIFTGKAMTTNMSAVSGIGAIASLIGGMIPGIAGSTISYAGMGLSIGAMFGGIGAVVGAIGGALFGAISGIFGKSKLRKKEEKIRAAGLTDALNTLRTQYDTLISDIRTLRIDPASGIAQGTSLGAQVRDQYMQMANSLKDGKTRRHAIQDVSLIDNLIKEKMALLRGVAEVAQAAGDRDRRMLPEFAGGVFMSPAFQAFRRRNGMLGGSWTGRDVLPAMLAHGEMVLNPMQQSRVRAAAGFDVFKPANIPGYAGGGMGVVNQQSAVGDQPVVVEMSIQQDAQGMFNIAAQSPSGRKVVLNVVGDGFTNDDVKFKRR